jgi:hypothetical protein
MLLSVPAVLFTKELELVQISLSMWKICSDVSYKHARCWDVASVSEVAQVAAAGLVLLLVLVLPKSGASLVAGR